MERVHKCYSTTAHVTNSLSTTQLREQVVDLERERDLLKENCDKLVTRWEISVLSHHLNAPLIKFSREM